MDLYFFLQGTTFIEQIPFKRHGWLALKDSHTDVSRCTVGMWHKYKVVMCVTVWAGLIGPIMSIRGWYSQITMWTGVANPDMIRCVCLPASKQTSPFWRGRGGGPACSLNPHVQCSLPQTSALLMARWQKVKDQACSLTKINGIRSVYMNKIQTQHIFYIMCISI